MTLTASRDSNATSGRVLGRRLRSADAPGALTLVTRDDEWREYARYRIKEILALGPDWDLEGAPLIEDAAAETARELAEALIRLAVKRPFILPSQEGGIVFEWITPSLELSLAVVTEDIIAHIYYPETNEEVEGAIAEVSPNLVDALNALIT